MRLQQRLLFFTSILLLFALVPTIFGLTWLTRQSLLKHSTESATQIAQMLAHSIAHLKQIVPEVEQHISEQMITQATILSYYVAAAERQGLDTEAITQQLKQIVQKTVLDEIWITDEHGHAYLHNIDGIDFTFSPLAKEQPQAHEFWHLLTGEQPAVIQQARKRDVDKEMYKYVGVQGVDKPRIVEVGYHISFLQALERQLGIQSLVEQLIQDGHVSGIWIINNDKSLLISEVTENIDIAQLDINKEIKHIYEMMDSQQPIRIKHQLTDDYLKLVTPLINNDSGEKLGTALIYLPMDEMSAALKQEWRLAISITAIALLIGFITVYALSIFLTRPVLELQQAVKNLAHEKWDTPLPVDRSDEMGDLARMFKSMAFELKTVFEELESRVQERTMELEAANEEISTLNEQLQADNVRMSMELDVTRRLQSMLLPHEEELQAVKGLDIAGFMQPAAEVGGDYYDVLQANEHVKIAIGDVTGHGLESGVLMLMVQTAVRTLLLNDEKDALKFINTLNKVIYENVQRMRSDRNLSLMLLDYEAEYLYVTGQHEEILIFRANGTIERIDTIDLGFPIGLEPDITHLAYGVRIQLEIDDVVILYTDGITEAENKNKTLYGIERLCDVVKNCTHCSAEEIRQMVIKDVLRHIGSHRIYDDITLLVLKRE
ncbi:SpoIIE family protein phosphatase [Candidatus Albibeggiatoa sp. nov. NOAA]|uniref:SpoIIE family protein phosphatase n=1 Tax=Candidatus Albibeggiatoa sp. nov. NOAA TaxID=3162724 RepID=UPI0032FE54DE|nr:SpoIIE family protein phosphatase [Thiotrichaceae bacterium]